MPINFVHELTDMAETDQLYTRAEPAAAFGDNPSVFQIKYSINKRLSASALGSLEGRASPPSCKQARIERGLSNGYVDENKKEDLKDGIVVKSEPLEVDEQCHENCGDLCLDLSDKKPRGGAHDSPRQPAHSSTAAFVGKSSPKGFESSGYSPGGRDALPDSSTGTCEQMMGEARRVCSADDSGSHLNSTSTSGETVLCQVCGDLAAGFYCGAYICEACKKFFIRASKLERPRYVCLRQKDCVITKESRVHCQYCRYQKCLELNMYYPKDGQKNANKVGVQEIPCRVCSAPSSGFHFGALTCEGCKGFFRRMVKEREAYSYKCSKSGNCEVNAMTRNMCKACRYTKCIQIGMSVDGSRIGRQPNAVKHAISLEAKKQIALKTEPLAANTKTDVEISSTNFNFSSVELDPCLPGDVEDSLQSLDHGHQGSSPCEMRNPKQENLQKAKQCPDVESSFHGGCSSDTTSHLDKRLPPTSQFCPKESLYNHYDYPHGRETNHPFLTTENPCVPEYHDHSQDVGIDLSMRGSSSSSSNYSSAVPQSTTACCSVSPGQYPPHCYSSGPLSPQMSGPEKSRHQACGPQRSSHCGQHNDADSPKKAYNFKKDRYKYGSNNVYRTDSMYGNYGTYVEHDPGLKNGYGDTMDIRSPPAHQVYGSCSPYHEGEHPSYHRSEQDYIHDSQDFHSHGGMPYQWARSHHNHSPPRVRNVYYETQPPQHSPERAYHNHSISSHGQCGDRALSKREPHYHYHKEKPYRSIRSPTYPSDREAIYSQHQGHGHCKPEPPVTPKLNANKVIMQFLDGRDITCKELNAILSQAAGALFHICLTDRAKSDVMDETRFTSVDACWEKMMEHFNFHAKCIVRFAKKVPGFRMLKIEDQVLLLRSATYGLVILTHSREFETDSGFYNYFNFSKVEQEKIMDLFPEFKILLSHFNHTGIMAKRLCLTDLEYAYLSCMLLLNDEYQGLIDTKRVKELKEKYMESFHEYEFGHFSNGDLRFGEMLLRLSEFSQFNMQHNIAVSLVITKNSQLHIPQLYAEMYSPSSPDNSSDWSPS